MYSPPPPKMDEARSDLALRIRGAFYGLAVCDALGGPLEFQPRRNDSASYIRDMLPNSNFNLPPGHFTDDTSMALCLAMSLAASKGRHDAVDQASRYVMWLDKGYMSSREGPAFDVGNQTRQALQYWRMRPAIKTQDFIKQKFNDDWRCGNGSLMRVLPCALVAGGEDEAMDLARRSSEVTHPHIRCQDACALYAKLVFHTLRGVSKERLIELVNAFVSGDHVDAELRQRLEAYSSLDAFLQKPREQISSSGYVLDSLEAVLWAFFRADTFEDGAIEIVNLGDDADTVGAIHGGLAGSFYGSIESIPERWLEEMCKMQLVDNAVSNILDLWGTGSGGVSSS